MIIKKKGINIYLKVINNKIKGKLKNDRNTKNTNMSIDSDRQVPV